MGSVATDVKGHLILFAYAFFGHQKSLPALAAKLVRVKPVYITYLAPAHFVPKLQLEFLRHFAPGEEHLRALIRLVSIDCDQFPVNLKRIENSFEKAYKLLVAEQPIPKGPGSEETYDAVPPPSVVLVDIVALKPIKVIRQVSGTSVKIFVWNSASAATMYSVCAPPEKGGLYGDLDEQLKEAEGFGLPTEEMNEYGDKVWFRTEGNVIKIPGLPDQYDYENYPQNHFIKTHDVFLFRWVYKVFSKADGVFLHTSQYTEGPAVDAWKEMYGSRPVFCAGPLSPPVSDAELVVARQHSDIFVKAEQFLDNALEKYGEKSVIFFSFGSLHWSSDPRQVWAFFDVILELKIPLIFSHNSPVATIPDEMEKKFQETGLVYHHIWLPQQMILRHKATAWFVTHCGQNSVLEAMTVGMPLICWPLTSPDQPHNAARHVALDVAYELFEVRTGASGLRPSLRFGGKTPAGTLDAVRAEARRVLAMAMGPDGEVKRKNALKISDQIKESWSPQGGHCWAELAKLLSYVN